MKNRFYIPEFILIFSLGFIIHYFNTKPRKINYNFAFSSQYDYYLPKEELNTNDLLVSNNLQYYRLMDSTNIAKRTYFNFNTEEKIEVLNYCRSFDIAFVRVDSIKNELINNSYKFIRLSFLHERLPAINPVS
jgi:hypothetical protein